MKDIHEAMGLVGAPYKRGGTNAAEGFDCFTLLRHVRRVYFQLATPVIGIPSDRLTSAQAAALAIYRTLGGRERLPRLWAECEPAQGCAVALGRYKVARLHHCGCIVNGGALHALESCGVVWTPWERVLDLYKRVECFECLR